MSNQAIARNYAQAFFDAATDAGKTDQICADVNLLQESLKSASTFIYQLSSPGFSQEERKRIISSAVQEHVSELTRNFLLLVVHHRRQNLLSLILDEFDNLINSKNQIMKAKLTSARTLDTAQRQKLQSSLEKRTGYALDIEFTTDPKLIAGFILIYGDTMYDCSTGSALNRFRNTLKSLRY